MSWKNDILVSIFQWSRQGGKFLRRQEGNPYIFLMVGYWWVVCQTLNINIKMEILLTRLCWWSENSTLMSFQLGLFSCKQQCASDVSRNVLGCLQGSVALLLWCVGMWVSSVGELDAHEICAGEQGQQLILNCWRVKERGHCLEYLLSPSVHHEEHPHKGTLN